MRVRSCICLSVIALTVLFSVEGRAQKFPTCTSDEDRARTLVAVREWYQQLIDEVAVETGRKGQLLDLQISIPYAENAYVGPYAGVLKCSVSGYAMLKSWDNRIARVPLSRVMVYYSYDQAGNLKVQAQPK
jgi:hypothetical protein